MTGALFSRRAGLSLIAAGAGMLAMPASATAMEAKAGAALRAYLRIRSRLDGKTVYYPYRGTIFGKVVGQAAVPLFDVEGFSWSKLTPIAADRYRLDTTEADYFLDRQTGLPLAGWVNPLNGVATEVKHYRSSAHVIVSDGKLEPVQQASAAVGAAMTASMSAQTKMNGRIWVHEDIIVKFPNKPRSAFADPREYGGESLEATSLATWSADAVELADDARAFVPALFSYQTLGSWRPFMRMGETPGVISWRLFGAKMPTIDAVSAAVLARVEHDYPDFLTGVT